MANKDFIKEFIKGKEQYNAYCHLGYNGNKLWNYKTVICTIDRENKTAKVNIRKYGASTSKIQSVLKAELTYNDFTIEEYIGEACTMLDAGTPNLRVRDFKDRR